YLRLVERIQTARPGIAMAGDFIVGFPGETEEDFRDTLRIVEEVGYASAFSFKYSPRPGTPASSLPQLDEDVKGERLARLQAAINDSQRRFHESRAGMEADVLFERTGRHPGQIVGRSPWLSPVHVDGPQSLIGTIARVTIDSAGLNSLFATLTETETRATASLEEAAA